MTEQEHFSRRTVLTTSAAVATLAALSGRAAAAPLSARKESAESTGQAVAAGGGGAVATVDPVATAIGIQVLRAGGNAVDAAVATAAALGLTVPYFDGVGGTAYVTIYWARDGHVSVIGDRTPAPQAFGPNDSVGLSGTGALVVGVPTTVRIWEQLLERYGTISLRRALQPAITAAYRGFKVDEPFHNFAVAPRNKAFISTREVFLTANGEAPAVGAVFRNPRLAKAYELIGKKGADAFYNGPISEAIVDTIKHPPLAPDASDYIPEAALRPGKLELPDLSNYRPPVVSPTHVNYRGYDIYSSPPPESGGSTVGEALNILQGFDLSGSDRALAWHRVIEASKLAYADRARWVGDPAFADVPLEGLLAQDFASKRRSLIGDHALEVPVAAGDPSPPYGATSAGVGPTEKADDTGHTQSFSVADRWGNVVTYTGTVVSVGGSGLAVKDYGFLFNNELGNFNTRPLFEGDPNVAAPGKRPRGNMAPTIVLRDGRPVLSIGVAGGQTIQTTVLSILVNHLDFGMGLPEALATARASQLNTTTTTAEPDFVAQYGNELATRFDQSLKETPTIAFAQGISLLPGGRFVAVSDTRGGGGDARVIRPL
ncbi:gamma-glutamyltransferase [Nonomuraea sp. NPDC049784]|uniref:gamma-glutamyltransferase family protein n=1 Tax=Nonomuraea sp. NPDC049784 TaxID=3154361 RepID=UPI0033EEB10E